MIRVHRAATSERTHPAAALIARSDVRELMLLLALAPPALVAPPRSWPWVARVVARSWIRLRPRIVAEMGPLMPAFLVAAHGSPQAAIAHSMALDVIERMCALRSYRPRGWRPRIELAGRDVIDSALAAEHGAVLWIEPFESHHLIAKQALHRAGLATHHVSRVNHPFSRTRFGMRVLNRIQTRVEDRYVRSRVLLPADGDALAASALRFLRERLRANELVSVTLGDAAQRLVEAPFFDDSLRLPTGPATLALASGAPLLPVLVTQPSPARYVVTVGGPLPLEGGNKDAAATSAVRALGRLLEEHARANVRAWRGPLTVARTIGGSEPAAGTTRRT